MVGQSFVIGRIPLPVNEEFAKNLDRLRLPDLVSEKFAKRNPRLQYDQESPPELITSFKKQPV